MLMMSMLMPPVAMTIMSKRRRPQDGTAPCGPDECWGRPLLMGQWSPRLRAVTARVRAPKTAVFATRPRFATVCASVRQCRPSASHGTAVDKLRHARARRRRRRRPRGRCAAPGPAGARARGTRRGSTGPARAAGRSGTPSGSPALCAASARKAAGGRGRIDGVGATPAGRRACQGGDLPRVGSRERLHRRLPPRNRIGTAIGATRARALRVP